MQVELAKSAGFCFGVQRAVDTVYKQIEENSAEKIYTYGPIIHGIPTEFHHYPGLPHGFGLGTGTVAEGWLDEAVAFWKAQM